ncbi:MAG: diguanylate cyclase [candidate division Zixibacteria bacterium]|nr:diguanylate cyclase [candidate division Zixibacteria bacterium]
MVDSSTHHGRTKIDSAVVWGDLVIGIYSAVIFYAYKYGNNILLQATLTDILIWLNGIKLITLYVEGPPKWLREGILFKLFIASNIFFIGLLGLISGIDPGTIYPFFLIIVFAGAYHFGLEHSWKAAGIVSLVYLAVSLSHRTSLLQDIAVHIGFIWIVLLIADVIFQKMKSSQKKLIEAMDSLNERTWELEIMQGENETIYTTLANLAGTLEEKELITKVLNISTKLLGAGTCKVFKASHAGNLMYLVGESDGIENKHYDKPEKFTVLDCLMMVDYEMEPRKKFDVNQLGVKALLGAESKAMFVPLGHRGTLLGCLVATSGKPHGFSESETFRFSALGLSAVMALENTQLMQKTEEMAIIDELTGMYNFRYFRDKLHTEINRAIRYKQDLSILMIDIDFFKKVNDTYGHQAGNMILQQLAGLVRRCIREVDISARYGGEEFVVILPETKTEHAIIVAERIRTEVEKTVFECGIEAPEVQITVSIGVAEFKTEYQRQPELLLEEADKNLYKAKKGGRNMVVTDNPELNSETELASSGDSNKNNNGS